ncbi:MAG: hypothetical protein KDI28_05750 [Pseudomonadales bacterium]|nr:hypothetical protein [Pseudomonadales bacterium]MCP5358802.1 hypothetical protein [Pseudomonadales bacterium]
MIKKKRALLPRLDSSGAPAMALLALLLSTGSVAQDSGVGAAEIESAVSRSIAHTEQVETLHAQIAQLTSDYGPYDQRLLPPLESLTRIMLEADNTEEASFLLDQQLQIHRINLGLYSAEQIPLVEAQLKIHGEAGDWAKLNDTLGYLSWLYQRDNTLDVEARLQGLHNLGSWHLRSLGNDIREREAHHLVELAKLDQRTAELAEAHFGEDNPALTPYLYDQALSDLYIALAIMLTSETAQDLMLLTEGIRDRPVSGVSQTLPLTSTADVEAAFGSRASTVIERSFKNNMDDNIGKLKRIQELYASAQDPEAEAMALMYLADSVLMRQQFEKRAGKFAGVQRGTSSVGSAMTHYEEALARFAEAGVSPEALAAFTRCPVLLPIGEFHDRLSEAEISCERDPNSGVINLGEHSLVSTLIPGLEGTVAEDVNSIVATVRFAVRANGQVSHHNVISIEPDDTPSRVKVRKLLEILQFRPALIDGNARRTSDVQLLVRIPSYN